MTGIMPPGPLSYEGSVAVPWIRRSFPPTTDFVNFNVPTVWIDTAANTAWLLVSVANGSALWKQISTSGNVLTEIDTPDGNTAVPSFGVMNFLNGAGMDITSNPVPTNDVTFAVANLQVPQGGTGDTTFTLHGLITGNTTSPLFSLAAATNGQIPIGNTGNNPTIAAITAGNNVSIVNAAGSITINSPLWSVIVANQAAVASNGYMVNGGALVTLSLPAVSLPGDTFEVMMTGPNGCTISQPVGTQIQFGNHATTLGVGGSLTLNNLGDHIKLTCFTANSKWFAYSSQGNLSVL